MAIEIFRYLVFSILLIPLVLSADVANDRRMRCAPANKMVNATLGYPKCTMRYEAVCCNSTDPANYLFPQARMAHLAGARGEGPLPISPSGAVGYACDSIVGVDYLYWKDWTVDPDMTHGNIYCADLGWLGDPPAPPPEPSRHPCTEPGRWEEGCPTSSYDEDDET